MVPSRFILLVIGLGFSLQALTQTQVKPGDSLFLEKFSGYDFKGKFAAAVEKDQVNTYYLVDLSKLPSRFERVWFMNECFTLGGIVNIDPDISKERILFMAKSGKSETEVLERLEKVYLDTRVLNDAWSEDKKSNWLNVNDKYK